MCMTTDCPPYYSCSCMTYVTLAIVTPFYGLPAMSIPKRPVLYVLPKLRQQSKCSFLTMSTPLPPSQGIAIDPDNDFLFAAGQDCRIRGWSLRTGNPLTPMNPTSSNHDRSNTNPSTSTRLQNFQVDSSNPLLAVFDDPVTTMQITREDTGMCLWAGSGKQLWQFNLGCRE